MKAKTYPILILTVFLLLGSLAVNAQPPGYHTEQMGGSGGGNSIRGTVMGTDGKPAIRVRVTISSPDITGETTYTNEDGTFKFGGLSKGNFTVTAFADGCPPANEYVTLERGSPSGQSPQVIIYLKADPTSVAGNPMLADVPKEAVKKFQKAAETAAKDPKGAIALLDEAIALHPKFALAWFEKGLLLQKQNDLDNAVTAFMKAIEIKPDYIDAKMEFGAIALSKKDYELAAPVFQDVIKQKNDIPLSYINFGRAMMGMNNPDIAEKAFKYALTMKGGENLSLAHRYLAALYIQKNKNTEAAAELQKYLDMNPKAPDADKLKTTIEDLKKKG